MHEFYVDKLPILFGIKLSLVSSEEGCKLKTQPFPLLGIKSTYILNSTNIMETTI